jgi:aminopeptidase N
VKQLQNPTYTPIYKLPVKVGVWVNGKQSTYDVVIDSVSKVIELPAASKPDLVLFDKEVQLLGVVNHPKLHKSWHFNITIAINTWPVTKHLPN